MKNAVFVAFCLSVVTGSATYAMMPPPQPVKKDCASCSKGARQSVAGIPAVECILDAEAEFTKAYGFDSTAAIVKAQSKKLGDVTVWGRAEVLSAADKIIGPESAPIPSASECTEVICLLTHAFGSREAALRALIVTRRDGVAVSLSQRYSRFLRDRFWKNRVPPISQTLSLIPPWTRGMLQNLDWMGRIIPSRMRNMKSLNSYLKAPDAFFMSANNVNEVDGQLEYITGRSSIIFGTGPDDWTRWAIVHELAHRFFSESSEILQNQFFKLSLWTQDETLGDHDQRYGWRSARKDACFADSVSVPASDSYARTNPSEDFAESVAAYLINHDAFSAKCPEKADFISKKMLDGYIAPAAQKSCDQSASTKTP